MGGYVHDYGAFEVEVLNAGFMVAEMAAKGAEIMARAVATAPVGVFPDKTIGSFKAAFSLSTGTYGGADGRRAYATVSNDDEAATYIEFGTSDTPTFRTLAKAAGL